MHDELSRGAFCGDTCHIRDLARTILVCPQWGASCLWGVYWTYNTNFVIVRRRTNQEFPAPQQWLFCLRWCTGFLLVPGGLDDILRASDRIKWIKDMSQTAGFAGTNLLVIWLLLQHTSSLSLIVHWCLPRTSTTSSMCRSCIESNAFVYKAVEMAVSFNVILPAIGNRVECHLPFCFPGLFNPDLLYIDVYSLFVFSNIQRVIYIYTYYRHIPN